MHTHILSFSIILLGVLVAVLHALALQFYLYWIFSWFDILMHFLAGILISFFVVWLYQKYYRDVFFRETGKRIFLNIFLFVFIVGLLWETFELLFGLTFKARALYIEDTTLDFIMNAVGATVGYFISKQLLKKEYEKEDTRK